MVRDAWRRRVRGAYAGPVRSAEELRERWIQLVTLIMERTGMYASTGREMQLLAGQLLGDLCFLDGTEASWEQEQSRLRSFGDRGVAGPFEALFGSPRCQAEVAAVYAEVFRRLGYLAIATPVAPRRWRDMAGSVRERFEDRDVRRSEAQRILGQPSLVVDRQVLCYAPADPAAGWLYVGCHAEQASRYDIGHGRYTADRDDDPLVRLAWTSGPDFEAGLILTLYGKTLRWGPGWWTRHPSDSWPAHTKAIAAQLRDITAADPSQALRSHGTQQHDHRQYAEPGG